MINNVEQWHVVYSPIDLYTDKYYIVSNIPTKPLPQGMLNHGGSFYFWKHKSVSPKTADREIGMCWEVG